MRLHPTLLAAAALLAVAVPSATAAPLAPVTPLSGLETGPALRGDDVLYATSVKGASFALRQRPVAGGAPTTLFTQARPLAGDDLHGQGLRASASRVTLGLAETEAVDPDGFTNYSVVRSGAGLQDVVAGALSGTPQVSSFDLDGDVLAYVSDVRAYVRDLADGAPAQQLGPAGVRIAKVAGPFLALGVVTDEGAQVIVYERASGTERYRVDVPITQPYAFGFDLDLQADGTVAVLQANPASTGGVPKQDLAWASLAEPTLHVVARDVDPIVARIAGDRILAARAVGTAAEQLLLVTLGGVVSPASFPVDNIAGADFDGSRVALATSRCLYVGDAGDPSPAEPPAGTCTHTVLTADGPITGRTSGVRGVVTCRQGPADGCRVTLRLVSRRVGRQAPMTLASRTATVGVGESVSRLLQPRKADLRKLRAAVKRTRRTAAVSIVATAVDPTGKTARAERAVSLRIR